MDLDQEQSQYQKPADPRTTYFFERDDGTVFATEEEEASELMYHTNNRNRAHSVKFLGGCDGSIYLNFIKQSKGAEGELVAQIQKKTQDMKRYMQTQAKLKFDDLLDEDDPKLKKVEEIISQHELDIEKLNEERNQIRNNVIGRAVDEVKKTLDPKRRPVNRKWLSYEGKTLTEADKGNLLGGVKNIKL